MTRTLYLSYDGILEPLGESQVVAYLAHLSRQVSVTLISFEKTQDLTEVRLLEKMRSRLGELGVEWIPLRYHKRPLAVSTAYDVLRGLTVGIALTRIRRIQLVHARGYVAALIALALKRLFGVRFLFDMRGFWADEKAEAGHWSTKSMIYRIVKFFERRFFESADAIVSLTEVGVTKFSSLGYRIRPGVPIEVIPTCTDLERFSPGLKDPNLVAQLKLEDRLVIGCTGTMSNWYLRQPMLDCLAYLRSHLDNVKILVVTREDHEQLRSDARAAGLQDDQLIITRAAFSAMPAYLRLMDLGLFFINPCFSKKGSSATKLGEFLATGVPVVINEGVGDSGWIVREHGVGVVLEGTGTADFESSLKEIKRILSDPFVPHRCRETAQMYFDLRVGAEKYARLYTKLSGLRVP